MGSGPNFFVIGAARSGTTALVEALRRHPQVFVTNPKEPHFPAFCGRSVRFTGPGDDGTVNRVAVTDLDRYLDLYAGATDCAARGEGSVSTLYYAHRSADTIGRHFPEARLVAVLRDPVERAWSSYQYLRGRGYEACDDFDAALDAEPERIRANWQHLWHYAAMGRYGEQLEVFVERFGPEQVQVLYYDDLVERPTDVLAAVHAFLGLAHEGPRTIVQLNASGEPRSRLLVRSAEALRRHPALAETVRRLVPARTRERLRTVNLSAGSMPAAARQRLGAQLAEDLARLRRLLPGPHPRWLSA